MRTVGKKSINSGLANFLYARPFELDVQRSTFYATGRWLNVLLNEIHLLLLTPTQTDTKSCIWVKSSKSSSIELKYWYLAPDDSIESAQAKVATVD